MSISRQISEFAVGLKFEDLPDEVIHEVKNAICMTPLAVHMADTILKI